MSLSILGFMGSGKTKLSSRLGRRLGLESVDLDVEIEKYSGVSITSIFKEQSEAYFRDIESHVLSQLLNEDGDRVISLGGGTPCFNDNMDLIVKNSFTVYLQMSSSFAFSRLVANRSTRPLISKLDDAQLREFIDVNLKNRIPYYEQASLTVEANSINASALQYIEVEYKKWLNG